VTLFSTLQILAHCLCLHAKRELLYGTSNGYFGLVIANNTDVQRGWTIQNEEHLGGINSMTTAEITQDGQKDIVLGRDDG
jgi:hypothetical protein